MAGNPARFVVPSDLFNGGRCQAMLAVSIQIEMLLKMLSLWMPSLDCQHRYLLCSCPKYYQCSDFRNVFMLSFLVVIWLFSYRYVCFQCWFVLSTIGPTTTRLMGLAGLSTAPMTSDWYRILVRGSPGADIYHWGSIFSFRRVPCWQYIVLLFCKM